MQKKTNKLKLEKHQRQIALKSAKTLRTISIALTAVRLIFWKLQIEKISTSYEHRL